MRKKFSNVLTSEGIQRIDRSFYKEPVWCMLILAAILGACTPKERKVTTTVVTTELPFTTLDLNNLQSFKEAGESWSIVGNVFMDEQHDRSAEVKEGQGILIGRFTNQAIKISTVMEHGDIDLKADFMLSGGAEASIIFQGRYPLRLADSWRKDSTESACGSILSSDNVTMSPMLNACKAPGLWQHLYVKFKAPAFDPSGKKTSNAVFKEVYLNGKLIQQNVEAIAADEKPTAPLEITCDDAPVAFRNIYYKAYNDQRITLQDIQYDVYKGLYKQYDTLKTFTPVRSGAADSLHWGYGDKRAQIAFRGTMNIPSDGDYLFKLRAGGPAWLLIDDKEIVNNQTTRDYTRPFYSTTKLTKGDHAFQVIYANYDESLVVEYEGPGISLTPLTVNSSERHVRPTPPMEFIVTDKPAVQRGFFIHHEKVDPYTMAVGIPGGLNYAYDLATYNLLTVWRGKFVDVSNMWVERGEPQLEIPLGAPLELPGSPPLLQLPEKEAVWTDTVDVTDNIYTSRSYRIDEKGLPVFYYTYQGLEVEDRITPAADNSGLVRKMTFTFRQPVKDNYFLVGSGDVVEALSAGRYAVADKEYYIAAEGSDKLIVVTANNGQQELLLPVSGEAGKSISFQYSITW